MTFVEKDDLRELSASRDGWHVSIYMPTHRMGAETQQDPIRLKNLLDGAEEELIERGVRRPATEAILAPALALIDDAGFWREQSDLSGAELHARAWEVVEPFLAEEQHRAADLYPQLEAAGMASDDLEEVVAAAHYGRVDTLFVSLDIERWGAFDPDSRRMVVHQERQLDDEDLLDLAAVHTLLNGGTVFAVPAEQVPDAGDLAALFRYSV